MVRRLALTTLVVLWLASLPAADSVRAQVGTLSQVAILTTSAAPNQEVFGTSVAVSADGSTIVVGAPAAFGGQRGAVYVFVRPSTGWSSTSAVSAILRSSDSEALDRLGSSVAVSANGDVIVAGAPSTEEQGAVYLWERPSAGWSGTLTQTVKLVPSKDQTGAEVGVSVALSANGGLAIAGAPAAGGEAGAVFVWERPAERWGSGALPETAILTASDGSEGALLGASVSVSADGAMVLAGSPEASNGTSPPGAGYVFLKPATGWTTTDQFTARLIASDSTTPFLGGAVALSGDGTTALLIVNAPSAPIGAGAGYVYVQPSTGWQSMTESATLAPIPGSQANQSSAALNGTGSLAVWGVPLNSTSAPGELALFARPPGGWSGIVAPARTASPSDPTTDGFFGWSTAVTPDGGLVVVGAPGALNGRGSVYLFSGPQLLSFSPATASPGDTVTIVGSNLDGVSGVTFGGVPALQFTAALTQVRAVVGLGATGAVALTTPQGVIALPGFTFAPGASSTAITSVSPSPSAPGAPVLVQFAVSTALGPPSGTVVVQASSGETCSAPVAAGGCQLVFATVGARSISAEFQGNAFFVASTSPGRVHVVQVPTTVALTVAGASLVGETIAASFAVSSSVGVPPGSVTVRANTGERCSAAVSVGSCPLTFLTPGDRVLTARYDGAAGYLASESAPALDSVRAATETAVVGDPTPDPSLVGAAVTVSYTVVSATGVPTGTVVVSATTGEACAATATAGSCSIVFATPGVRSIVATYSGNGLYLASASLPISHTVGVAPLAPTTTTITSVVPSPSLVGRPLTVTYAVTSSVGSPTGAVIVRASTGESCSGAAPAGSCSLVFAAPGVALACRELSWFGDARRRYVVAGPPYRPRCAPRWTDRGIDVADPVGRPDRVVLPRWTAGPALRSIGPSAPAPPPLARS
ncbi:MAG: hypothetical protein KatS3mg060_3593 [Dehalococcoidia bacterium]|nr:MAG: hypothetical protein KatS3mg060_3593 [Dehalococcoidia bacterium]